LNQITDNEHYSSTIIYDDSTSDDCATRVTKGDEAVGWGKSQFISHEELNKITPTIQYLKVSSSK